MDGKYFSLFEWIEYNLELGKKNFQIATDKTRSNDCVSQLTAKKVNIFNGPAFQSDIDHNDKLK